jgi:hypothetical protein
MKKDMQDVQDRGQNSNFFLRTPLYYPANHSYPLFILFPAMLINIKLSWRYFNPSALHV